MGFRLRLIDCYKCKNKLGKFCILADVNEKFAETGGITKHLWATVTSVPKTKACVTYMLLLLSVPTCE